jgi:hypothetical protein
MSLSTRTKYISGFVSCRDYTGEALTALLDTFKAFLNGECDSYAYILHSLDVELDEGGMPVVREDGSLSLKTPHFHFVCVLNSVTRVSTFIKRVADATGLSPLAITASKCSSVESSVQYLIHKNDPEKHQYPVSDIVRKWDDSEFDLIMASVASEVSFDYFWRIVVSSQSIADVVKAVGISRYHAYRATLIDLFRCAHGGE